MTYKWSETSISICGHFVIPTSNSKASLSSPSPAFFTLWLKDTKSLIEIFIFLKNKTAKKRWTWLYSVILHFDWKCLFYAIQLLIYSLGFLLGKSLCAIFCVPCVDFTYILRAAHLHQYSWAEKVQTKNVSTKKAVSKTFVLRCWWNWPNISHTTRSADTINYHGYHKFTTIRYKMLLSFWFQMTSW